MIRITISGPGGSGSVAVAREVIKRLIPQAKVFVEGAFCEELMTHDLDDLTINADTEIVVSWKQEPLT